MIVDCRCFLNIFSYTLVNARWFSYGFIYLCSFCFRNGAKGIEWNQTGTGSNERTCEETKERRTNKRMNERTDHGRLMPRIVAFCYDFQLFWKHRSWLPEKSPCRWHVRQKRVTNERTGDEYHGLHYPAVVLSSVRYQFGSLLVRCACLRFLYMFIDFIKWL